MEWIRVKERIPKHMQECMVIVDNPFFGKHERSDAAVYLHFKGDDGCFYDSEEQTHLDYITHWMPLPDAPKED